MHVERKKPKDSSRKDDVVTFEQLGVDRLYVDEAHNYKNLFLYTKMRNVAGLSATDAYFAVKSKEAATTPSAPKEIGKVNSEPPEKDFFTKEEVDAMTSEQRYKNADKILASFSKWKRK